MRGYKIKNLNKNYLVSGKTHQVLKNIDTELNSDEITIILGKSGCGKTTLLRLLAGLENTSDGEIKFFESDIEMEPKVGMIFQDSRLFPWLTVRENLTFYTKEKNKSIEEKYLKIMKLEDFAQAYPSQLSGGMAQRVAIGRALAYNPHMLLMDEPFASLDYFTRYKLQEEIIDLYQNTNKGMIFVTHNVDEALLLGHRIIILDNGSIVKDYKLDGRYPRKLSSSNLVKIKEDILETICIV